MTTKIQMWGNSQGIRIPKFILEALNWNDDEELVMTAENDKIVIKKAAKRMNIKDLFADYDGEYAPVEVDWGKPVGKEVW